MWDGEDEEDDGDDDVCGWVLVLIRVDDASALGWATSRDFLHVSTLAADIMRQ